MSNLACLLEVITLAEAGAMWAKHPRSVLLKLERMENKNPDEIYIRRSGKIYLTTISAMRLAYGQPVEPRPDYGV